MNAILGLALKAIICETISLFSLNSFSVNQIANIQEAIENRIKKRLPYFAGDSEVLAMLSGF